MVADALVAVPDGDAAGFERVKQGLVARRIIDPETAAQYDITALPQIKAASEKWRAMKTFEMEQEQGALRGRLTEAQIAATNRSNRPQVGGGGRGGVGPVAIDPATGQPIASDGLANVKLTEQQSKDIGFLRRAQEANTQLDDKKIAGLTNTKDAIARSVPIFGRALQSDQSRQGVQVGKNFLAAVLRKDTGAAVTDTEFDYYSDIFLPQWGDDDGTLQLKARARSAFLEGLRAGMSNGAALAQMGVIPPPELAPREDEAPSAPAPQGQPAPAAGAPQGTTRRIRFDANGNMVQ